MRKNGFMSVTLIAIIIGAMAITAISTKIATENVIQKKNISKNDRINQLKTEYTELQKTKEQDKNKPAIDIKPTTSTTMEYVYLKNETQPINIEIYDPMDEIKKFNICIKEKTKLYEENKKDNNSTNNTGPMSDMLNYINEYSGASIKNIYLECSRIYNYKNNTNDIQNEINKLKDSQESIDNQLDRLKRQQEEFQAEQCKNIGKSYYSGVGCF